MSHLTYIRNLVLNRLSRERRQSPEGPVKLPDSDSLKADEWRRFHQMAAHRRRQILIKMLLEEKPPLTVHRGWLESTDGADEYPRTQNPDRR